MSDNSGDRSDVESKEKKKAKNKRENDPSHTESQHSSLSQEEKRSSPSTIGQSSSSSEEEHCLSPTQKMQRSSPPQKDQSSSLSQKKPTSMTSGSDSVISEKGLKHITHTKFDEPDSLMPEPIRSDKKDDISATTGSELEEEESETSLVDEEERRDEQGEIIEAFGSRTEQKENNVKRKKLKKLQQPPVSRTYSVPTYSLIARKAYPSLVSLIEVSRTLGPMERSSEVCLLRPVDLGLSMRLMSTTEDSSVFKSSATFKTLENILKEDTEGIIEKAPGIYRFNVKNKDGKEAFWIINASTDKVSVTFNGKEKPDVTFFISDEDVIDLLFGKLYPPRAYFQGKIKIVGKVGMAMKLAKLLKNAVSKMGGLKVKL